jgi:hypothetical protein
MTSPQGSVSLDDPNDSEKMLKVLGSLFNPMWSYNHIILALMRERGISFSKAELDERSANKAVIVGLKCAFGSGTAIFFADRDCANACNLARLGVKVIATTHGKYLKQASWQAELVRNLQLVLLPVEQAVGSSIITTSGAFVAMHSNLLTIGRYPNHPLFGDRTEPGRENGPPKSFIGLDPEELLQRMVAAVPGAVHCFVPSSSYYDPRPAISWEQLTKMFPGRVGYYNHKPPDVGKDPLNVRSTVVVIRPLSGS